MAQAAFPHLHCPVKLGSVNTDGPGARLHQHVRERSLHKLEKQLKKGVDVDTVNNLGQTPLFCASLLSLAKVVDVLLQYGANPNHRCDDRSTPVHAAAFSCSPWILSALLDVGGDLRLHDREGRTARDWAEVAGPELSPRMLKFMQSCVTHMQSLTQQSPGEELTRTSGSSNSLIRSPSLLSLLKRGGSDLHLNRMLSSKPSASDTVHCFGFGKLCVGGRKQFGFLACVPVIGEKELVQADDEPSLSFHNGAFMSMTNFSWNGCRVTVKELQSHDALLPYSKRSFMDLLTAEQEYCCNLFHPHLLQLLAVCVSANLEQTRLVFERVHIGSLYSILHQRRAQFPVLRFEALLHLLLQVSDALLYLHCRGFIHRSLSSHAVQLVHPGVAKLTNLHFMVHSSDGGASSDPTRLPIPAELYNWASPEVIRGRPCTVKADLYSLCALIQELCTDTLPWGGLEASMIKELLEGGHGLAADTQVPQPYYEVVRSGLQLRPQERTGSLQDIRYLLRKDMQELSCRKGSLYPETDVLLGPRGAGLETQQNRVQGEIGCYATGQNSNLSSNGGDIGDPMQHNHSEILRHLYQLDQLLEWETDPEGAAKAGGTGDTGWAAQNTAVTPSAPESDLSIHEILPLDPTRLSLRRGSDTDTGAIRLETDSDSTVTEDESEGEGGRGSPDRQHGEGQAISTCVLNLKVSQVLKQQAENSLLEVKRARGTQEMLGTEFRSTPGRKEESYSGLGGRQGQLESHSAQSEMQGEAGWGRVGLDEVDKRCSMTDRDVEGSGWLADEMQSCRVEPASSLYPSGKRGCAQAVAPPRWYQPPIRLYGIHSEGEIHPLSWKNQLLRETHSDLPATANSLSDGLGGCEGEDCSDYSSALEDSFVTVRRKADRGSVVTREAGGRQQFIEQVYTKRGGSTNRTEGRLITAGVQEGNKGGYPLSDYQKTNTPNWTSEVAQLIEKMARGQLGAAAWSSREEQGQSSESEDMEELFYRFTGHSATTASTAPSHDSPTLESLFRSFAGHQSLSETDSEPQTMNKTFNISPRVQRSADPGKVEQSSGSDFMPDSSLEVSDEFFTPNPLLVSQEAALHSGRQALVQTPSSEEDLEVTVEVLWPRLDSEAGGSIGEAGGSRAAVERPLDTEPNSAVVCASSPVTSFKAIGVSAEVPAEVEVRESEEV
ncbi:inactive serine/threonine-protein kinase TEX14-like [Acipenser ruthenus]|uniref:inactive serine/threonine-protein kinase TEX14-like n=1 Tax=Acipenser ruthenus TaxID=7906 RepID=UPI00274107EE|nr:inactive serine/threonine-protein kinase TEX14-like [Acipenser ruthenus]